MKQLTILSMGWGKQTFTMAAMMALGEMGMADYAVFADTEHEGQGTYDFVRQWEPWLEVRGLKCITVKADRTDVIREDWSNATMIPAFTKNSITGSDGQVRRQCTHDWKITPIRRFIRQELATRGLKPRPGIVECWQGISWDEALRMRDSDVRYVKNRFPLVEARLTRMDCIQWLQQHDLPVPPKSACTFCPYSSKRSWAERKRINGKDWQEALLVDQNIRERRPLYKLYVHAARLPLQEAVSIAEDYGASQAMLEGFEDICDGGFCGV